ncbi:MAG TPA: hypothetical protein VLK58_14350, partial [Conexibacter sp.]|nr:hypothetical protein [Conexibacter sp.]
RSGELKQRRGTLEAQLDGFARATERLRADELLRDGERPSAASERFEAEREDLIGQRHELDERIRELGVRREATAQRRDAARAEAAEQAAAASELERRRDAAVARVADELGDPPPARARRARRGAAGSRAAAAGAGANGRAASAGGADATGAGAAGASGADEPDVSLYDALDVAAGWQPLDEPGGAERAIERARAAADGRRATVANEIDARAADERALERDGLLAVESDVERICGELEAIGMQALPALRHLSETARADRLPALIAAQPGLAAGIVLLDDDPHEAIVELTAARVRLPRRPLLLARADELVADAGEAPRGRARRGTRAAAAADAASRAAGAGAVLLPDPAAYDPDAAQDQLELVAAARERLSAERERHGRLSARLGRLAAVLAGEAEQLRGLLPQSGRNERRLLGAVARELGRREEQAQTARGRAEEQERVLTAHSERLAELTARREQVAQAERRCERALERLETVDDLDAPALRAEFERLAARSDELTAEADTVRRRRDALIRDAKGLEDRLATVRGEAGGLRRRAAELPLDGVRARAQEGSLSALSERLVVAEQLLESRISDGELRARMAGAEARAARLRSDVERAGEPVRERARALADSPAGIDPQALARGRREAKESYEKALREQGEAATVEGQAAERLYAATEALTPADRTREPKLLSTLQPEDPAHGAVLLGELNELREGREREVADNRAKLADSDERVTTEQELLNELRAGRARLAVAEGRPHVGELPAWVRRRDRVHEQVTDAVRAVESSTRDQALARQQVAERLRAIDDAVAAADERIPRGITAPLRAGEALAPDAGRLEGELRTRAGELDR